VCSKMTREEIAEWFKREPESEGLTPEEFKHVVDCLQALSNRYWENIPCGHFLTAIINNDFGEACGRADNTNRKVLTIYDKFLFNCIPADYKEKLRKE